MMNDLHINLKKVESARNDVEYWLYVIRAIYLICPKGYIELQALCFHLYGLKAEAILEKLKAARVDVEKPIVMTWDEESAPALLNKVFFPLSFVTKANEFISLVKFSKDRKVACHQLRPCPTARIPKVKETGK